METVEKKQISILNPVSPAIEKTKEILFRPFDIKKWFVLGFSAWLAQLMSRGINLNLNLRNHEASQAVETIKAHPAFFIGITVFILLFVIGFVIAATWLSSRGKFMFIHCIVNNRAEIKSPWNTYKKLGDNLFVFRIILGFLCIISIILSIVILLIIPMLFCKICGINVIFGGITGFILFLAFSIGWTLFFALFDNFIVPIMFIKRTTAKNALKEFWPVFKSYTGKFLLYFLFTIVIAICFLLIALTTCCLTCCLVLIPYLGTVILLPLYVFYRSYSLYFLSQFDKTLDVWKNAEPDLINTKG